VADVQVVSEAPINVYQLKKDLESIKQRDKELNFRANKTEEYLNMVATSQKGAELFDRISKLSIPRLKEQHIHKIIDILPTSMEELKSVLQAYTLTINNDSMKKIVDAINDFLEK